MAPSVFDVIVVGGGIAGSCLAGVLARTGLGVFVVEKERLFRDRIRGEGTWPWGVAEARQAGLAILLETAGTVGLRALKRYEDRRPVETVWDLTGPDDIPGIGFLHPQLQEAAFAWAATQGATMRRPAKAIRFARNGKPLLTVVDGREEEYTARLIVGADGKLSMTRRWTGGESVADPENHRMGGVLISGAVYDRDSDNFTWVASEAVNWFAAGSEMTRLYLVMSAQRLRETEVDRSFAALVALATERMPEGALDAVQQEGPIGFFPNNDIWASQIAGNDVVLIGDAAAAPDPTQGHGTALLFHDVRHLSELLLSEANWETATAQFADRRRRAFAVIREVDCWSNVFFDTSAEAERLREGHERAREHDPTLGGFAAIETCGPYGLVADEEARRRFFGENLVQPVQVHRRGGQSMTLMTSCVRVGGDEAALVALENQGLFGAPLGESLDGPMLTAGLRQWTSGNGQVRAGLQKCTEGRFRTTFRDDEGEVIWVVSGHLTCDSDSGPTTGLAPGDTRLFLPGWRGEWRIAGTLRKVFVGWQGGISGLGRDAGLPLDTYSHVIPAMHGDAAAVMDAAFTA